MKQRKRIIAVAALAVILTAARVTPVYDRLATAANAFHSSFQNLRKSNAALNPLQRVMYSLVLAGSKVSRPHNPHSVAGPRS